jgi:two-component system, NarL family, response regulator NreC
MKTRILIADDHEVVRQGLKLVLEQEPGFEICGVAKTGKEAVQQAKTLRPDIVVLDMSMPELTGVEAARQIKRAVPEAELLIFTANENEDVIRQVFDAGAKSYIRKADAPAHLVDAVKSLRNHKPFFTSKVSEVLFARFLDSSAAGAQPADRALSEREREVVRLLGEGKSNKEVAAALNISPRTAEVHRAAAMKKVGVKTFSELIRWAIKNNIIQA